MNSIPVRFSVCFLLLLLLLFKRLLGPGFVEKRIKRLKTKSNESIFSLEEIYFRVTGKASLRRQTMKQLIFVLLSRFTKSLHKQDFIYSIHVMEFVSPLYKTRCWGWRTECQVQSWGTNQILFLSTRWYYLPYTSHTSPQWGDQNPWSVVLVSSWSKIVMIIQGQQLAAHHLQ